MSGVHTHGAHGSVDIDDDHDALRARPRTLTEADRARFEGYLSEIFVAAGMDVDSPGTLRTFPAQWDPKLGIHVT